MIKSIFNILFVSLFLSFTALQAEAQGSRCVDIFSSEATSAEIADLERSLKEVDSELLQAKQSSNLSLVNAGQISIKGKLGEVLKDQNGDVSYLRFVGPTELLDSRAQVLPGQGKDVHSDGYSTAIGSIKTLTINSQTGSVRLVKAGDLLEVNYQSGVRVQGKVNSIEKYGSSEPQLISLSDCTVEYAGRILYKPNFGPYDLILSKEIVQVDNLPIAAQIDSKTLSTFYKTDVSHIRQDGLAFYNSILERFEKQKTINKNPYEFPFEEGRGVLEYMKAEIQSRISKYETDGLYWRPTERRKSKFLQMFKLSYFEKAQKNKLETELTFLKAIQEDLLTLESQSPITYKSLLDRSYDFLMVMQGTQIPNDAEVRTYIYEFYHRTTVKDMQSLYEEYRNGTLKRYGKSRYSFAVTEKEIFNPDKLEVVIVPVVGFLLASDLIANRNVPIHYATVNGTEARADGFVQDPLTLYLHDIKFHAGQRQLHDTSYFEEKRMSETDIKAFRLQQKIWIDDFISSYKKIPDQKMRTAIVQAAQTITHDRGKVFAPSTFNENRWRNFYFIMKGEVYVTVWGQPNKAIGTTYGEILPYMSQAYDWVNDFWLKYKSSKY